MSRGEVIVSLRGVTKDYGSLRPLRIEQLELSQGDTRALLGFDRAGAQVLVDLITAAALPDAGEVDIFGTPTRSITDVDAWLRDLDRFGILSERAILLDELTTEQNLALPLSLEIGELPEGVRAQVAQLAVEVGIPPADLAQAASTLSALARSRVRLGKALALEPRVLLAEHPTATLSTDEVPLFAADLSRIAARRDLTLLVITADAAFARAVAEQVLTLQPATGTLQVSSGWRRWFRK